MRASAYRIPLVDQPIPPEIELCATFPNSEVPDSLVFGKSGRLYVSLAGTNQIAILDADGAEITRISGPAGSSIPVDGSATMAFDNTSKSLLVANLAMDSLVVAIAGHLAILDQHQVRSRPRLAEMVFIAPLYHVVGIPAPPTLGRLAMLL
ncbi:hypothetical protein [uncultured Lamprocystis sp.]|uniref:hypothetical protein n=1 Tax=uncultured Lamprocystis sp. TaxID=543132 RepID=UPI0025D3159C|nr:hypothetical protein [uncultured Lamprocystis sp.]